MNRATIMLLTLACVLGGCGTTHELAPMANVLAKSGLFRSPKQRAQLEQSMTDADIAKMLDVQVKAKLPTSLAIAKLSSACNGYQPALENVAGEELAGWREAVAAQSAIRDVRPISHLAAGGGKPSIHGLRAAAARQNCELLLVYIQADAAVDNFNDAAALYWTIVGLVLAPGNVLEHKTVMQGVLIDCRTGMILGTASGSEHLRKICPAAFVDNRQKEMAKAAPPAALAELQKDFVGALGRTIAAAMEKRQQRPTAASAGDATGKGSVR